MSKTIKYDTVALFSGPWYTNSGIQNYGSGDIRQFARVQSTDFSFDVNRRPQGKLGSFFEDEPIIDKIFVDLNVSYYPTDGYNESLLGFFVDGKYSSVYNLIKGQKDYFALYKDTNGSVKTAAFGNGRLQSYSMNLNVGGIATSSANIRCENVKIEDGFSGNIPRLVDANTEYSGTYRLPENHQQFYNPKTPTGIQDIAAIGQGQIEIDFGELSGVGVAANNSKFFPQSLGLYINFEESVVNKIGDLQPVSRESNLPFRLRLDTELFLTDLEVSNLKNLLCSKNDVEINFYSEKCGYINEQWEEAKTKKMSWKIKNLKLLSQSDSDGVGRRKTVNLSWESQIYDANILADQFLISGYFGRILSLPYNFHFNDEDPPQKIIEYKNYYPDFNEKYFYLDFTGQYDVNKDYEQNSPFINFSGDIDYAFDLSGNLNSGLSVNRSELPLQYFAEISGIRVNREFGYSGEKGGIRTFDNYTKIPFVVRSDSPCEQNIDMSFNHLEGVNVLINFPPTGFKTNLQIPIYFYNLPLQSPWLTEPNEKFTLDFIANNDTITKKYFVKGETKNDKNIGLNPEYYDYFNFWMDSYRPERNFYREVESSFYVPITESQVEMSGSAYFNKIKDYSKKNHDFWGMGSLITTSGHPEHTTMSIDFLNEIDLQYYNMENNEVEENFNSFCWFFSFKLNSQTNVDNGKFYKYPLLFSWADDISGNNGIHALCSGNSILFMVDKDTTTLNHDWFTIEAPNVLDENWHVVSIHSVNGVETNVFVDNMLVNSGQYSRTEKTGYKANSTLLFKNRGAGDDNIISGYVGEVISSPINLNSGEFNDINEYLMYKWIP